MQSMVIGVIVIMMEMILRASTGKGKHQKSTLERLNYHINILLHVCRCKYLSHNYQDAKRRPHHDSQWHNTHTLFQRQLESTCN